MLKKSIMFSLLCSAILITGACSSDEADANSTIVGKWYAHDKDGNNCPDTIQLYDDDDNTFSMTYSDQGNVTGTYKDLDQNDDYKLEFDDEEHVFKIIRDGDTLTVSDSDGNDACTYQQGEPESENQNNVDNEDNTKHNNDEDNAAENDDENNDSTNEDEAALKNEYENYRSNVDPVDDAGDTDIWFEGESTLNDEQIAVFGQTNLLPGTELHVNPTGKDSSIMGGWSKVTVEDDGTFYAENEIPSNFDDQVLQEITFTPENQNDDKIKDHYQPETEEVQGPFSYLETDVDDELTKTAKVELAFPEDQAESTVEITAPDWDKPDDYGDTDIWIEADIDKDNDYVYIKGESNLLEGTKISASYEIPDKIQIGYNDNTRANPDGSFEAKIKNPEEEKGVDNYDVILKVSPNEYSWPNVIETYGENGEELEGSLTEEEHDSTVILKQIPVK